MPHVPMPHLPMSNLDVSYADPQIDAALQDILAGAPDVKAATERVLAAMLARDAIVPFIAALTRLARVQNNMSGALMVLTIEKGGDVTIHRDQVESVRRLQLLVLNSPQGVRLKLLSNAAATRLQ